MSYMPRRDRIAIQKILRELKVGQELLGDTSFEDFNQNEMMKRAIAMTVINVGELTKVISDETRIANPGIPWKAIAGMRDIAAHKYQTLRMEDVYNTVRIDFPTYEKQLQLIYAEMIQKENT